MRQPGIAHDGGRRIVLAVACLFAVVAASTFSDVQRVSASAGVAVQYKAGWNLVGGPDGSVFNANGNAYSLGPSDTDYETSSGSAPVKAGQGYWMYFSVDTTATLNGLGSSSGHFDAPAGRYVMVGNPDGVQPVRVDGADQVLVYDPATNDYQNTRVLAIGQGGWAYSARGGTLALTATDTPSPTLSPFNQQRVLFQDSQGLMLEGYFYKPNGAGPFPAVVWNHGSEQDPDGGEFVAIAQQFVSAGYVVMAPVREGHGQSQGQYISDAVQQAAQQGGKAAAEQKLVQLMSGPQLDDQLSGLAWLKSLPFVDGGRIAVVGCSYGGIQTLLGAEANAGYRAAVAISPAAESWMGNVPLQQRLIQAVDNITIPVILIQPPNDASLQPSMVLGAEAQKQGKQQFQVKVFPPSGDPSLDVHCFGGNRGDKIWAPDALQFLASVMGQP